jgi:hypothetical protein
MEVTRFDFGWGKKKIMWPASGAHQSAGEERERGYRFGKREMHRGPFSGRAGTVAQGPFHFFLLPVFLFLSILFFITFVFELQMRSNHFLKFYKMQHNILK